MEGNDGGGCGRRERAGKLGLGLEVKGKQRAREEAMIISIQNGSALVVLSPVQNSLSHAVGILSSSPLALAHVDIGGDLLPTRLNIQLRMLFLQFRLFPDVILCALNLLLFLLGSVFLKLVSALLSSFLLVRPLSILNESATYTLFLQSCLDAFFLLPNALGSLILLKIIELILLLTVQESLGQRLILTVVELESLLILMSEVVTLLGDDWLRMVLLDMWLIVD